MKQSNKDRRLTVEDMFEKYPNEWLFIVEPEICEQTTQLMSGIVQVHSPSRDIIHKASKEYVGDAAIKFSGEYTDPERRPRLISFSLKNPT